MITVAELYYGAYKSNRVDEQKEKVEEIKNQFTILEMNEVGAQKFGELLSKLEKDGKKISDRDVLIAAIALSKGENAIVTRNTKDFERISELSTVIY